MKQYFSFFLFFVVCIKTTAQHKILTLPAKDSVNKQWEFSLWGDYLLKPDNGSYFNPTFYADNKSLRIEGRYNYESFNTASVFAGKKFYTPTLVEVWRTAPYLHDGRSATLHDLFTPRDGQRGHGITASLSEKEKDDLIEYVLSQ